MTGDMPRAQARDRSSRSRRRLAIGPAPIERSSLDYL